MMHMPVANCFRSTLFTFQSDQLTLHSIANIVVNVVHIQYTYTYVRMYSFVCLFFLLISFRIFCSMLISNSIFYTNYIHIYRNICMEYTEISAWLGQNVNKWNWFNVAKTTKLSIAWYWNGFKRVLWLYQYTTVCKQKIRWFIEIQLKQQTMWIVERKKAALKLGRRQV